VEQQGVHTIARMPEQVETSVEEGMLTTEGTPQQTLQGGWQQNIAGMPEQAETSVEEGMLTTVGTDFSPFLSVYEPFTVWYRIYSV
jgi:hypothetical protein